MEEELVLDSQLKYWVLIPISVVMVLVGLLRSSFTALLSPGPKKIPYKKIRETQFLRRAECFRASNNVLDVNQMESRRNYFIEKLNSSEYYSEKISTDDTPKNPFTDSSTNDALMSMMKGNLLNYIPQSLIMAWVNFFFADFIVMKLPFPLTDGFKSMLQSGVATPDLNVRYVSAISWYFVNLLGLKPIYNLLGDNEAMSTILAQSQQTMPNIGGPGAPKVDKIFQGCAENIKLIKHESIFDGIASRVIDVYS